jgi:hypothetical protein
VSYDERDRLLVATSDSPSAAFTYSYASNGNVTSGPLGSYTYGDAAHKHAATVAGSNSYALYV